MPKIVTLEILVNEDADDRIVDGLNEMLAVAQLPVDADVDDSSPWILDWRLCCCGDQLRQQSVCEEVSTAIRANRYEEGSAFPSTAAALHPGFNYDLAVVQNSESAKDSLWISIVPPVDLPNSGLALLVKRTGEGLIADIYPEGNSNAACLSSAFAMFTDVPDLSS